MRVHFSLRWQVLLVVVLFAASLLVLLSSALGAIQLPGRERQSQQQLTEASRRMAEEAAPLLAELPEPPREPPKHWQHRLTDIANSVLEELEGVEGGFYLADKWDTFFGHAFPTKLDWPTEPPLKEKKKKIKHPPPRSPLSDGPPPNEKDPIRNQCLGSLNLEEGAPPPMLVREIGPSRVMIVTEPVGRQRPAKMAAWVMTRLTSPEHTAGQLVRFQTSAGLALAGMAMALVLMANLGRNLHRERRQREQLREELRRAEHFAALGKMLAGVAHEVRNPLAAIRSTVQLFQRLPRQPQTALGVGGLPGARGGRWGTGRAFAARPRRGPVSARSENAEARRHGSAARPRRPPGGNADYCPHCLRR